MSKRPHAMAPAFRLELRELWIQEGYPQPVGPLSAPRFIMGPNKGGPGPVQQHRPEASAQVHWRHEHRGRIIP